MTQSRGQASPGLVGCTLRTEAGVRLLCSIIHALLHVHFYVFTASHVGSL